MRKYYVDGVEVSKDLFMKALKESVKKWYEQITDGDERGWPEEVIEEMFGHDSTALSSTLNLTGTEFVSKKLRIRIIDSYHTHYEELGVLVGSEFDVIQEKPHSYQVISPVIHAKIDIPHMMAEVI